MGSTRLPGKVLMRVQGKSILARAVERLGAAQALDGVVVLTTTRDEDEVVEMEARRLGVEAFRGPDLDVLARFRLAADCFRPEVIVRATADNPLIDIGSVDRIVRRLIDQGLDYCTEVSLPIGAATEVMSRDALARVDRLSRQPHHREHVTTYFKEHRGEFRASFLEPPEPLRRPDVRITVDTADDLAYVTGLIQALPESGHPRPLEDYLALASPRNTAHSPGCAGTGVRMEGQARPRL
jgi:spore coat polysaccharide biosynthesis protein SpsF